MPQSPLGMEFPRRTEHIDSLADRRTVFSAGYVGEVALTKFSHLDNLDIEDTTNDSETHIRSEDVISLSTSSFEDGLQLPLEDFYFHLGSTNGFRISQRPF